MVVVISRFTIANDMVNEVMEAFRNRPHLVDATPGYRSMEVMNSPDKPEEIWLLTRWDDEQSFRDWHKSHQYRESHRGIPKGLKLVPQDTEIRLFNVFAA